MDPNQVLADLMELTARVDSETEPLTSDDAEQMAEKFIALNDWMRKGGFLPTAWAKNR